MGRRGSEKEDLLSRLSSRYRELKSKQFPEVDLPPDYDDLYAEWAELDGFVAGLAMRALRGEELRPSEILPHGHDQFRQRLERLQRDYPQLAPPVVELFRFMDEVLDLLASMTAEQEPE